MTIADIFAEYLDKRNIEQAVNVMVNALDLTDNYSAFEANDALIKNILGICSKNYYSNIEDCEWFLLEVLKPIMLKIKKEETAILALNIFMVLSIKLFVCLFLVGFYSESRRDQGSCN